MFGLGSGLVGCAGPTTPLGAVWALFPSETTRLQEDFPEKKVEILSHAADAEGPAITQAQSETTGPAMDISPSKQILHGPAPLRLQIKDPSGDLVHFNLWVRYNGFDVSKNFVMSSKVFRSWDQRMLVLENRNIRLPASSEHQIEFIYRNSQGEVAYLKYEAPSCYAFRPKPVLTTAGFRPPKALLGIIDRNSTKAGLSPAFFTALIAQESGFNTKRVSWHKALGLTQVTSIAEGEVASQFEDWPRYPDIDKLSAATVKFLIMSGKINRFNEWRLDPTRSIQGGVAFAVKLAERWSSPENMSKIKSIFRDPEAEHTRLILASYNSGYARVQYALAKYGKNWITSPQLKEARKYVNSIFSYCDFFAETEETYVEAT